MRQLVYHVLSSSTPIRAIIGNRIWSANSLGEPPLVANPKPLFLVIQSMPNVVARPVQKTGRSALQTFDIRAYDERGDYGTIDTLLRLVREELLNAVLQVSPSGARCSHVEWMGFGPDSDDPILDKIFKTCSMRFLSNQ